MATQITSQRQAAAKKPAATRKRNATKRSASSTSTSARRTTRSASASARETGRSAPTASRQASRTAGRGLDTALTRFGVVGRRAQRALLIQVVAAATAGEKVRDTARTYTSINRVKRELDRFERRGARTLKRRQRTLKRQGRELRHDVRSAQRRLEQRVGDLHRDAKDSADQVTSLI